MGLMIVRRMFRREGTPERDLDGLPFDLVGVPSSTSGWDMCFSIIRRNDLLRPIEIPQFWDGGLAPTAIFYRSVMHRPGRRDVAV